MRPHCYRAGEAYWKSAPLGPDSADKRPPLAHYNRPLDRQSDSDTLRFGGKEGFDDMLLLPRNDSLSRIPKLTKHVVMLSI